MKKLIFLLLLGTLHVASALQVPPQPGFCPSVEAIQGLSFLRAEPLPNATYAAIQIDSFKTRDTWAFVVANIAATSPQDALNRATAALSSLAFERGPIYFPQHNVWACLYKIRSNYLARAITPLPARALNTPTLLKELDLEETPF